MSAAKTTACAVIALLGDYFPVAVLEPEPPQPGVTIDIRIEGENETIWSGTVTVDESMITADNSDIEHHLDQTRRRWAPWTKPPRRAISPM